jgi:hypothetical protein
MIGQKFMMPAIRSSVWVWLAPILVAGVAQAQLLTLSSTLESDTFCDSASSNVNYETGTTGITNSPYFLYARNYSTVSRFGVVRWRLPVQPPNSRVFGVRLAIYSWTPSTSTGPIGFAKLTDNPDLSTLTWTSAISSGYIAGRNTSSPYNVILGAKAVTATGTLTGVASGNPAWLTFNSTGSVPGTLCQFVADALSTMASNTLTLLTLPADLTGGLTDWRGGSIESAAPATLDICFARLPAVPVTNDLLVALDGHTVSTSFPGRVSCWLDAASQGGWQDFFQSAAGNQPNLLWTNMPNGRVHPVLDFNPSSPHYLQLDASPIMDTNTWTWFIVFRPDTAGGATRVPLRSGYTYTYETTTTGASSLWGTFLSATTTGPFTPHARRSDGTMASLLFQPEISNQWFVNVGVWNGTTEERNGNKPTSVMGQLWDQNGVSYPVSSSQSTNNAGASPTGHTRTRIGWGPDGVGPFDGQMAEILIYRTALSSEEITAVVEYLEWKYLRSRRGTVIYLR